MTNKERAEQLISKMTVAEKISQLIFESPAIDRLGIPEYNWWNEALHGVGRAGRATVFPQSIGLASTFNKNLIHKVGDAIATEIRAKHNEYIKVDDRGRYKGVNVWSPNINIFRDPRWGRGHETYGECPVLTAEMGISFVNGIQGDNKYKYKKAGATLKHYAVHSGPETGRDTFDSLANQKDLYETYLYAFHECIKKAKPTAVMSAYNKVNGIPATCSKDLLENKLRQEMSFDGYVVSDCGAVCWIADAHKYASTKVEAAAIALKAGCDLNCGSGYNFLKVAFVAGLITEEDIDKSLIRLFEARYDLGLLDCDNKYDDIGYECIESKENIALSLESAKQSLILLKNNGILPLKENILKIAIIGCNANDRDGILGNYNGTPSKSISVLDAFLNNFNGDIIYAKGSNLTTVDEYNTISEAVIAAKKSQLVIMVVGLSPRLEGENGDAFNSDAGGDKMTLALPTVQYELFNKVADTGKPIVIVNISGSCVLLNEFQQKAEAIIQAFYPGAQTGNAVYELITGAFSPSGKLPVTFYNDDKDLPDFSYYSMQNRTYRYFEGQPLYEFGFGLSYSSFLYTTELLTLSSEISFNIENIGSYDSYETWQMYVSSFEEKQPQKALKAFDKVFLKRGEKICIRRKLKKSFFELFNQDGEKYVSLNDYTIGIGSSSNDIKLEFKIKWDN